MKARVTPTRTDIERVCEATWKITTECIADGNAVMLVAVKRFFGLGPKRMKDFMEEFEKVRLEFDEHDKDGLFHEYLREELEQADIDVDSLYHHEKSFAEVYRNQRMQDKQQAVSMREAADVKKNLDAFRRWTNAENIQSKV